MLSHYVHFLIRKGANKGFVINQLSYLPLGWIYGSIADFNPARI